MARSVRCIETEPICTYSFWWTATRARRPTPCTRRTPVRRAGARHHPRRVHLPERGELLRGRACRHGSWGRFGYHDQADTINIYTEDTVIVPLLDDDPSPALRSSSTGSLCSTGAGPWLGVSAAIELRRGDRRGQYTSYSTGPWLELDESLRQAARAYARASGTRELI